MYQVIKETVNSNGNTLSSELLDIINCHEDDIVETIGPLYKKLADSETLKYKIIGSDKKVVYTFKAIVVRSIVSIIDRANISIHYNIAQHNHNIKERNIIVTRGNKKYGRDPNHGIQSEVDLRDFNNPFYHKVNPVINKGDRLVVVGS